jgi:hypothetical protein
MGPTAASEPETQVSTRAIQTLSIHGAIDMHSYSQLILRPYDFVITDSPDEAAHAALGTLMRNSIAAMPYRTQFTSQKSIGLYVTTGTFEGQGYGSDATPARPPVTCLSFTLELRPTSANPGFQLPPAQIIPSGTELVGAFNIWLDYFKTRGLSNNCGRR